MSWLKLCRLTYRICFKLEAPSYICRWIYINDLTTYLRKTFYRKYQSLCVYYYHSMFDDPGFTHSISDCVYTIVIICLMTPFYTKYQWLCVYYYHNMFDDAGFLMGSVLLISLVICVLSCYVSLCSEFRVVMSVTISP